MKKIFILLIFCLCISGCYDYRELDNLSYVVGYGLDYKNGEYILTFELLNNKKEGDSTKEDSFVISGTGANLTEANFNIIKKLNKTPFFSHSKVLVVSKELATKGFEDTMDFILRDNHINSDFLVVMAKNNTPEEIFNNKNKKNLIVSNSIYSLLKDNTYSNFFAISEPYSEIIEKMASEKEDAVISVIDIDYESKDFEIVDLALFKNYKIQKMADLESIKLFNPLNNKEKRILLEIEIDNETIETLINFTKVEIEVKEDEIFYKINANCEIQNFVNSYSLKDSKTYKMINEKISEKLKEKLEEFTKYIQKQKTDILGFEQLYYYKTRKDNNDLWLNAKVNTDLSITTSSKGGIYNAN